MTTMTRSRGWGFKIDYVAAIADDERVIASLQTQIKHGLYAAPTTLADGRVWTPHGISDLVLYMPGAAASLGLTSQDVADYAHWMELNVAMLDAAHPNLPSQRPGKESRLRMIEVEKMLSVHVWPCPDETTAKISLRKAKASLARHKRNQAEFGPKK